VSDFVKIAEMREPLVPISILELDLPTAPAVGWPAYLAEKGITVLTDDLGRLCVARGDAKRLFDEHREAVARRREVMARNEQKAIEADRLQRAQIWGGVRADSLPVGVSAGDAMAQAAKDAQPKRQSPMEEAFSGKSMVYHEWPQEADS
jgi:hypothetical protein